MADGYTSTQPGGGVVVRVCATQCLFELTRTQAWRLKNLHKAGARVISKRSIMGIRKSAWAKTNDVKSNRHKTNSFGCKDETGFRDRPG